MARIDLLNRQRGREKELQDFLTSELPLRLESSLAEEKQTASGIRSDVLGKGLEDVLTAISGRFNLPQVSPNQAFPFTQDIGIKLSREVESAVANRRRLELNKRFNLIFNSAFDQLVERGVDVESANAYARQLATDEVSRNFRATEAEKNRQDALRREAIEEEFAQKGLEQERNYDFNPSIKNAMLRSLVGLGGILGTGYALTRKPKEKTIVTNSPYARPRVAGVGLEDYGLNKSTSSEFAGQELY